MSVENDLINQTDKIMESMTESRLQVLAMIAGIIRQVETASSKPN